jgi:hypothetical protein
MTTVEEKRGKILRKKTKKITDERCMGLKIDISR